MKTKKLTFPLQSGTEQDFEKMVGDLKRGCLIGYPTETIYGIGGDALNKETIQNVFFLKRRRFSQPLLVLVRDAAMLEGLVEPIPKQAAVLMQSFWPGPLTLLFKKTKVLPDALTGGVPCVGIRVSPDPVCRQVLEVLNRPLISTSANPSGQRPALDAATVFNYFSGAIDWILDGGPRISGNPSSLLDVTRDPPVLLREGQISRQDIEAEIGDIRENNIL